MRSTAYNAALESLAEEHLNELEADARTNPSITKGITVGVFDEDEFLGYGRVIEIRWSRFEMRHEADILMYQGTKLFDVQERDLEPGTWTRL
jgi:hypothetical protein